MNSDRIMVLDRGEVVEMDSPARLAAIPDGHFARLMRDASAATGTAGQDVRMHRENSLY
jgi:hypothetical protein